MRRWAALVTATAVLATIFTIGATAPSPAGAAAPSIAPSALDRPEAPDYRTDQWADPWDFSGPSDGITIPEWFRSRDWSLYGGVGPSIAGGTMSFTSRDGQWFELLQTKSYPPTADDAFSRPLDPSTYSRMSFRLRSSASVPVLATIAYHDCFAAVDCYAAHELWIQPGWNTYDFDPRSLPICCGGTAQHDWSRPVGGIRIAPNFFSYLVTFDLDWFRIYQPTNDPVAVDVGADAVDEVWWDADADQANDADSPTAGKFAGATGGGQSVTFDTDAYPPGSYRFYTVSNGVRSAYSDPVTVAARPQPVILDPDVTGGDDWATTVRGDPWDFSNPGDIVGWGGTGPGDPYPNIAGGIAQADSRGSAQPDDPFVSLAIPTPIDATTYHRLSVRQWLDGPWSLGLGPGGGAMGRLIWMDGTSGGRWRDSSDIVEQTGVWNTITIDLHTDPRSEIEDETSPDRRGFGVPGREWVDVLRWDPHEDAGGRSYAIDWIKLARNDQGKPSFAITYQDNAWTAGTTADIYVDTDDRGFDGTKIAGDVSVADGVNTYQFSADGIGAATWWIYIVMKSPNGTSASSYSTGPVDMPDPNGFTDVLAGDLFYPPIRWLVDEGITGGYGDGTFRPTAPVTRQAIAAFLWRYEDEPAPTGGSFSDVAPDHLFSDPIRWLASAGIASGFEDGTFRPTTVVSRQALASFLYKMAGSPAQSGATGFTDVPADHLFSAAIGWLASEGIASGYQDGSFQPNTPVSRQAAASMIYKFAHRPG